MTGRQFAAALGFAFVALWISLSFGWALLCLAGAAAFYVVALVLERALVDITLQELASRVIPEEALARPPRPTRPRVR
ncbi:MAG: hypothetical protein WKF41_03785 [Gaiellaceae bacterium]